MATEQFANNAQTTLSAAITSTTATSISVASASGFPSSAQFRIRIDNELMLVTGGAGTTTWTVTRGIEGTTAATHSNGATVTQLLTAGGLVAGNALKLDMYNLKALNNSTTPNTQLDIKPGPFDPAGMFEVVVEDNSSPPLTQKLRQSSTITIDSGVTGANGLDTGTLAASTWYYFYIIAKPDGTTAGLLSTSATSPTMPSGYTYKALIGAVHTDASTHFQTFVQLGKVVNIPQTNVMNGTNSSTSWTSLSMSTVVPPIASVASGLFGMNAQVYGAVAIAADSNGLGEQLVFGTGTANLDSIDGYGGYAGNWRVAMKTAQTIYWKAEVANQTLRRIDVTGWEYP